MKRKKEGQAKGMAREISYEVSVVLSPHKIIFILFNLI